MSKRTKPKPRASGVNQQKGYLVRAPDAARELWREAAEANGSTLADWSREVLTVEAATELKLDPAAALELLRAKVVG